MISSWMDPSSVESLDQTRVKGNCLVTSLSSIPYSFDVQWGARAHFTNNFSTWFRFHSHFNLFTQLSSEINAIFCILHNSCAVMTCAKFCSDLTVMRGISVKLNFDWIWITVKKLLAKMGPRVHFCQNQNFTVNIYITPVLFVNQNKL